MPTKVVNFKALTSLRFLAAACIVAHHLRGSFGVGVTAYSQLQLASAVPLFFVLSGFVLTHAYYLLEGKGQIRDFLIKRWFRIWPVHITCLLLFMVIYPGTLVASFKSVGDGLVLVSNVLLLQSWVPFSRYYFSYNAVSWSISTEWFFYLMFPLIIFLIRRKCFIYTPVLLSLAALAVVIYFSQKMDGYSGLNEKITTHSLLYISPVSRIFEFIMGCYSYLLFFKKGVFKGAAIASLAQVIAVLLSISHLCRFEMTFLYRFLPPCMLQWFGSVEEGVIWSLLISSLATSEGMIVSLLSHQWLVYLGELSFCIYMTHYQITMGLVKKFTNPLNDGLINISIYLFFVLLISVITRETIEKYGMNLAVKIKNYFRKKFPYEN